MSGTLPNPHLSDSEKEKLMEKAEKQAREHAPNEEDEGNVQEKRIAAWLTATSVKDTLRAMADLSWDELHPVQQRQLIDFINVDEAAEDGGERKKKKSRRRKKPRRKLTKKRRKVTKKRRKLTKKRRKKSRRFKGAKRMSQLSLPSWLARTYSRRRAQRV